MTRSEPGFNVPKDIRDKLGDRYSDIKYVSSGATSLVFSAHDSILDKRIALKVLTPSQEQDFIRFQKEAKAASQLDHRKLVKILDFDVTQNNQAYLIMDFVDGNDLENVINSNGPLSVELAIEIALQICEAMEHAHQKQIVHRDLKASNIVVSNFGTDQMQVTVVDFGLARLELLDATGRSSGGGRVEGSPRYMSPEQAQGKSGDARCDLYALGCIIFKMITGDTPFEDEEVIGVLRKHISQAPPRLSDRTSTPIPQELEEVVARLLEKQPQMRYQSMSEALEALEEIPLTPDLPLDSMPAQQTRRMSRTQALRWSAIIFVPIVLGLFLLTPYLVQTNVEPESKAPDEQELALKKFTVGQVVFDEPEKYKNLVTARENELVTDEDLRFIEQAMTENCQGINLSSFEGVKGDGIKYLKDLDVGCVSAKNKHLDPIGWRHLAQIKTLKQLELDKSNVSDADIAYFANHPSLYLVILENCDGISDDALSKLATIKKITKIDLSGTKVTDEGLKALRNCSMLSKLYLESTQIGDQGLKNLSPCPSINDLHLIECSRVTGNGIKFISQTWPKLSFIELGGKTTIKTAELNSFLRNAKRLRHLHIVGVTPTDETIQLIGDLKDLQELYITKGGFSQESLQYLHPLKKLRSVTLWGCKNISLESIDELRRKMSHDGKHYAQVICPFTNDVHSIPFNEIYSKGTEMVERE